MYKLHKSIRSNEIVGVFKTTSELTLFIPFVEDNTDYREYLAWVAEGNTPLPADE